MRRGEALEEAESGADDVEGPVAIQQPLAAFAADDGPEAEIAIPRSELTGDPITLGKVWACNVVRVVPGKGLQSWSLPADVEPRPEGMGLLIFTDK